jgi:hypothetical protein
MPHNPDRLLTLAAELEKPLEQYLKWRAICDRYERGKSSKLAEIIATLPQEKSYASRESEALASEGYKTYLSEFHEAEKNKIIAQVKYENLKCQFEALQSVLAYERDAMRRLG